MSLLHPAATAGPPRETRMLKPEEEGDQKDLKADGDTSAVVQAQLSHWPEGQQSRVQSARVMVEKICLSQ